MQEADSLQKQPLFSGNAAIDVPTGSTFIHPYLDPLVTEHHHLIQNNFGNVLGSPFLSS